MNIIFSPTASVLRDRFRGPGLLTCVGRALVAMACRMSTSAVREDAFMAMIIIDNHLFAEDRLAATSQAL